MLYSRTDGIALRLSGQSNVNIKRTHRAIGSVSAMMLAPFAALSVAADQGQTSAAWKTQCTALASTDLSTIEDAPSQVIEAKPVEARPDVPAHCQIEGYVTPNVGFSLMLSASNWNGKFLEIGCGGDCGSTGPTQQCNGPLRRGYACILFDAGHKGSGGLWAYNNLQTQIDFGYRGAHVAALAGKAITERYYTQAPKHSYFTGCSTGGRQALVEAQRFPWDFDGIIAGAPWINDTASAMQYVWNDVVLSDKDGKSLLSHADLQLVHDAALAKCDRDDGVKDRIIGNPLACRFDPATLVCKAGESSGCITQAQADAVKKVYAGPTNSKGEKIYTGGSPVGSELDWASANLSNGNYWAIPYFRYEVIPAAGPSWQEKDFDFDRDDKRFAGGVQESLLNAANPDLRKFKAAGGRLLIYQGGKDADVVPANTIDYYETLERTMGGHAATQDFARLFIIPGMGHCSGGEGAFAVDYLTHLEGWVEQGKAPEMMIGARVSDAYLAGAALPSNLPWGSVEDMTPEMRVSVAAFFLEFPLDPAIPMDFTRPIYPYPLQAKYRGTGDANSAASFRPAAP